MNYLRILTKGNHEQKRLQTAEFVLNCCILSQSKCTIVEKFMKQNLTRTGGKLVKYNITPLEYSEAYKSFITIAKYQNLMHCGIHLHFLQSNNVSNLLHVAIHHRPYGMMVVVNSCKFKNHLQFNFWI